LARARLDLLQPLDEHRGPADHPGEQGDDKEEPEEVQDDLAAWEFP
jgi:hypothetical protein